MTYNNIKAYRSANHTLDNFTQLLMLYDTAIASMQQAKDAIGENNIEKRYNKLEKAFLIVTGLRDILDMEKGADVAETLREWYTGLGARILSINTSADLSMADLCMSNLKEMRDAFVEAKKSIAEINVSEAIGQSEIQLEEEAKVKDFLPEMVGYVNTANDHKPMAISI